MDDGSKSLDVDNIDIMLFMILALQGDGVSVTGQAAELLERIRNAGPHLAPTEDEFFFDDFFRDDES